MEWVYKFMNSLELKIEIDDSQALLVASFKPNCTLTRHRLEECNQESPGILNDIGIL